MSIKGQVCLSFDRGLERRCPSTILNADTIAALSDPSVHGRLAPLGYESRPDAPETVGAFLRAEVEIWSRVIKQAGIGPEK